MTYAEAAKRLGRSEKTVRRWTERRGSKPRLRVIRFPGRHEIREVDLEDFIRRCANINLPTEPITPQSVRRTLSSSVSRDTEIPAVVNGELNAR